ncbi:MAG: signal peptidase I [Lachnospiraceae bacterium]|nr:signal peptidase I [Lachnospiraceae bacterium]
MARRRRGLSFYNREKRLNKKVLREIGTWVFWTFAMALLAFVFVFCFGIRTSVIGVSMEPSLYNGQEVLINRFAYFWVSPKAGDVVVFLPNGNENSHYYIKRIVGVPGDTVLIQDGLVYVNGEPYEEAGVYDRIEDAGIAQAGVTLGEDEYFVLGDNRNNSEDSRSSNVGVVKKDYIIGIAWFRLPENEISMGFIE